MSLYLVNAADLKTQFEIPKEASADVTLRRICRMIPIQILRVARKAHS